MNDALAPLTRHFAHYLCALDPEADSLLMATLERISQAVAEGHVCIELGAHAGKPMGGEDYAGSLPDLNTWTERLRSSPLVGSPGDFAPLILDGHNRLYLARYWQYEQKLADNLRARSRAAMETVDIDRLRQDLDHLFAGNTDTPDWQKAAAAAAVLQRFCVISGGPGTGKTSTVVRLLAALQLQHPDKPLRIALAAPTGKAAARMQEAIRRAKTDLAVPEAIVAAIPEQASTLHRLLGSRPDSIYFRHNRENPLGVDVLVVDEASMIDLALMAKVADALPGAARLILLGDKDQLASVEAGAVFGEICACRGRDNAFRQCLLTAAGVDIGDAIEHAPPLGNAIMLLQKSYRFSEASGIGELARLINANQAAAAADLLARGDFSDVRWRDTAVSRDTSLLAEHLEAGYRPYFEALEQTFEPAALFRRFERFRVLTAHREGESGVAAVNRLLEEHLRGCRRIPPRGRWYHGRPVMITHNDYNLKLFNGDIGIALEQNGELRVFFESIEGGIRSIAPPRLPPHETVYAMTVHKSQGSEFDHVLMLLPDARTEVLNRALLYTGVTRARRSVEIWGRRPVLESTIREMPQRASGLLDRLTE